MFAKRELDALGARKAALLRASEINRGRLVTELVQCRTLATWVDAGMALANKAGTVMGVFSPLLGRWCRRSGSAGGFLSKLAQVFTLAQSAARLWSALKQWP